MHRFRPSRVLAILLLSALSTFSLAQSALIPRGVLFGNPERSGPEVSPDGTLLAYLAPDQGVLNAWVRTLGQTDDPRHHQRRKRGVGQPYFLFATDRRHCALRGQPRTKASGAT